VDDEYYYTRRRWLEHRRALGLPDDDDPAMCRRSMVFEQQARPSLTSLDPPPSYFADSSGLSNGTPSLYVSSRDERASIDSGNDEKEAVRSFTSEEAITPSCQSVNGTEEAAEVDVVDMQQQFIDWDFAYDSAGHHRSVQDSEGGDMDSVQGNTSSTDQQQGLPPPRHLLRRHQMSTSLDSLPAGTVGAVAIDKHGNLAAATSTGGITNKFPGRLGDTPMPGAGFWAEYWKENAQHLRVHKAGTWQDSSSSKKEEPVVLDKPSRTSGRSGVLCNWIKWVFCTKEQIQETRHEEEAIEQATNCQQPIKMAESIEKPVLFDRGRSGQYRGVALSGTGTGDYFLRCSFASLVVHRMRFLGEGVDVAGSRAVAEMGEIGGVGGAICIDNSGSVSFPMNSATMNRGYITNGGSPKVAIYAHEECL
jgi:hypothetical protein